MMSLPAPCRRPGPRSGLVVDEAELSRFRTWLIGRGYAERTADLWAGRVRSAFAHGASLPAEVAAAFEHYPHTTRSGARQALRALMEFREAGGCGGSS